MLLGSKKLLLTSSFVIIGAVAVVYTGLFFYGMRYDDKTLPGLVIGEIPVGNITRDELTQTLQQLVDRVSSEGITIDFGTHAKPLIIFPLLSSDSLSIDIVSVDMLSEVDTLMNYGKKGSRIAQGIAALYSSFAHPVVSLQSVVVDEKQVHTLIEEHIGKGRTLPVNASLVVDRVDPYEYTITSSSPGIVFSYDHVADAIHRDWSQFVSPVVNVSSQVADPDITENVVANIAPLFERVIDSGPFVLTYTQPDTARTLTWSISPKEFSSWVTVISHPENGVSFSLSASSTDVYLTSYVKHTVDVRSRDAKFSLSSEGKVVEFEGSRTGIAVDVEATHKALDDHMVARLLSSDPVTSSIAVVVTTTEPMVTTADVNTLGIRDVLGVGVSSFAGSPKNRLANIRNAVQKLNGLLIKPGETFSTIAHTQPYTEEGGYLPELVIKGDEIKPEIGGGLCQIGTTLFRMAMNSGLDITERRNHSLVVNYYNDLENGLPGTDATIYDPAPDFRFTNDTNQYILLQTDMNVSTGLLTFTLWGTDDGRKGTYTRPVVHKWMSPGPTKIVETSKLAPGQKTCQHAYRGAQTSFTYTRTMPDGTVQDRVFESYYRPLPEICLVGAALPESSLPLETVHETSPLSDIPLSEG